MSFQWILLHSVMRLSWAAVNPRTIECIDIFQRSPLEGFWHIDTLGSTTEGGCWNEQVEC